MPKPRDTTTEDPVTHLANLEAEQAILQHAMNYGPVREFSPVAVPLTELYQEVVQS